MTLRISIRARDDLAAIYGFFFARYDEHTADALLTKVREAFRLLENNPELGVRPQWRTRHKTLRFWVVSKTRFLIFYFYDETGVSVERVLDGRRDVQRVMNKRTEHPNE